MIQPTDCIAADFTTDWYLRNRGPLDFQPFRHNKQWEQAIICQALLDRGALGPGKVGLGMGVGLEPLVSLFASLGADVVATDQPPGDGTPELWQQTGQLADGKASLYLPGVLKEEDFDARVTFEHFDMNLDEPSYHGRFDFIWHNCVIGHLGSMELGIRHLERSAQYLKPGGWLVFTTELNIASVTETILDNSETIIWRIDDLVALFDRMAGAGMLADRIKLRLGDAPEDRQVCHEPVRVPNPLIQDPAYLETKTVFAGFVLTQIVLCFQKDSSRIKGNLRRFLHRKDSIANERALREHAATNEDLADYWLPTDLPEGPIGLRPVSPRVSVTMAPGETKEVELVFENGSQRRLFAFGPNMPYNTHPLTLATLEPINRDSVFHHQDWFSDARPLAGFVSYTADGEPCRVPYRALPGERMHYRFPITAPLEEGDYVEAFCPVLEGIRDFAYEAPVHVDITVSRAAAASS